MKNKKAVSKMVIDIWAYVLFFLIIALFLLIIMVSKKETTAKIEYFKEQLDADYVLMTYLRSPVPDMNMDFAELIKLTVIDRENYELKLTTKNEEIMNRIGVTKNYDWFLMVKSKTYTNLGPLTTEALLDTQYKQKSKIQIPSEEDISVTLYLRKK